MPSLLLLALLGLGARPVSAALPATAPPPQTHCDDGAVRREWAERVPTNPDELDWQALHALWLGWCTKVQAGDFTTDQADAIFEVLRQSFIERRREDKAGKSTQPQG
jgi:hypothetical protein